VHGQDKTERTGTCAVLVTRAGERALVANLGAANRFGVAHLETGKALGLVAAAKFIYVPGFFLTVSELSIGSLRDRLHLCFSGERYPCLLPLR